MTNHKGNTKPAFQAVSDGEDHINIYSNGRTKLGRDLSHFSDISFVHKFLGPFKGMEGFWYYIRSEVKDDNLRNLVGFDAKKYGKRYAMRRFPEFPKIIMDANYQKIVQNPSLYEEFVNSELPFDHYYIFKGKVQVRPTGFDFLTEGFEELRTLLKEGKRPEIPNYQEIFGRLYTDREV